MTPNSEAKSPRLLPCCCARSPPQLADRNLTASARAIAEAELPGGKAKRNAEMIVANTAAMHAAIALSDTVDAAAIRAMHRALMVNESRHTPGEFRTEPVWIGRGSTPIGATFVGPSHEAVPGAIGDLIAFAQRADVPTLPQIAVGHAQFETIHPFKDGNGRTGRALVQGMLRNKGLTRQVTVPVSAGLLADTDAYFAALTSYRDGDAAPIVDASRKPPSWLSPTGANWSPTSATSERPGTTSSPHGPTRRRGRSPIC